jgi:hypothetical protein
MPPNTSIAPRWPLYASVVLLAAAAFFAGHSWQAFRFAQALQHAGARTEGRVVDVSRPRGRYPSTVYTVAYTVRGSRYRLTNRFTTNNDRYRLGERVPVRYTPASPEVAMLDDAFERNVWGVDALVAVGIVALGGLFYRGYRAA